MQEQPHTKGKKGMGKEMEHKDTEGDALQPEAKETPQQLPQQHTTARPANLPPKKGKGKEKERPVVSEGGSSQGEQDEAKEP